MTRHHRGASRRAAAPWAVWVLTGFLASGALCAPVDGDARKDTAIPTEEGLSQASEFASEMGRSLFLPMFVPGEGDVRPGAGTPADARGEAVPALASSSYFLTIQSSGEGDTFPAAGNVYEFALGTFVCVNAQPRNELWRFDRWEGDVGEWGSDYFMLCVTMDRDRTVTAFFVMKAEYTLTVNVTGNGMTDPGAGIHTYLEGNYVTMSAAPGAGSVFDHWEGDYGDTDPRVPTCSFVMNQDREVTAFFAGAVERTLTVRVTGSGATDPEAGVYAFLDGAQADLVASPEPGWRFDHWEGNLGDADPTRENITLAMTEDREATAVFAAYDHLLTIRVVGDGATLPEAGIYGYDSGASVYVAAIPETGRAFDRWLGDVGAVDATDPGLRVVMDQDRVVEAVFVEGDWDLTLAHGGDGSGRTYPFDPGIHSFVGGRTVELRAVPDKTYYFGGWQGDVTGFTQRVPVLMDSDKTVTAVFATAGYVLTVAAVGQGTTSPAPAVYPVAADAVLTLHAFPTNSAWRFDRWEGDVGGADVHAADLDVTVDQDRAVTAVFVEITNYTLELAVVGSGQTNLAPGAHVYPEGYGLNLWAVPNAGWHFDRWEGDIGDADAASSSIALVMDRSRAVTAVFAEVMQYTLALDAEGSGTTAPAPGAYVYREGHTLNVGATPDDRWRFDHWEGDIGDAVPTVAPLLVTMDRDRSVTAVFTEETVYTLTISATGEGTIDPAAGAYGYEEGHYVIVSAAAAPGWFFDHWEGDIGTADPRLRSIGFAMGRDRTVTAVFGQYDHTLEIGVSGDGTTAPAPGLYGYAQGYRVDVSALPAPGTAFVRWEGDTGSADPFARSVLLVMDQDRAVTAVFAPARWTLTIQIDGNGSTVPVPGVYGFLDGQHVSVAAEPGACFAFDRWQGDASGMEACIEVVMDRDKTIEARFAAGEWKLVVAHGGSGAGATAPAAGEHWHLGGRVVALSAVPKSNSFFGGWQGDVTGYDPNASLLMDSDKAVTALFAASGWELTINVVGACDTLPAPGVYRLAAGAALVVRAACSLSTWRLQCWQGDLGGADPSAYELPLTMDRTRRVTAVFEEIPEYTLTVSVVGDGVTDPLAGAHLYRDGTEVAMAAVPAPGWRFDRWQGDLGEEVAAQDPVITVIMDRDRALAAHFAEEILHHSADLNGDGAVDLSELLRVVQFWNAGGYRCAEESTEDGFAPGDGDRTCVPHSSDCCPQDWRVDLSELLRLVQIYNLAGYHACPNEVPPTEDGFCVGPAPSEQ